MIIYFIKYKRGSSCIVKLCGWPHQFIFFKCGPRDLKDWIPLLQCLMSSERTPASHIDTFIYIKYFYKSEPVKSPPQDLKTREDMSRSVYSPHPSRKSKKQTLTGQSLLAPPLPSITPLDSRGTPISWLRFGHRSSTQQLYLQIFSTLWMNFFF